MQSTVSVIQRGAHNRLSILTLILAVSMLFGDARTGAIASTPCQRGERATPPAATGVPAPSPVSGDPTPCAKGGDMTKLEECLVGRWLHAHEEDTAETKVYRPESYPFPPARGRDGFEFKTGGALVYLGIARADGTEESIGRWTIEAPNRVRITVEHERIEPFTIEVISCDQETLRIRR